MPAISKNQQKLMSIAYEYKIGRIKSSDLDPKFANKIKNLAKSMSIEQLRDFAKTDTKLLPSKVNEHYIKSYSDFLNESIGQDTEFSFDEVGRLIELGIIQPQTGLFTIYYYVKNRSIGDLVLERVRDLEYLPSWLTIVRGYLDIEESSIKKIPDSLEIDGSIFARDSDLIEFTRSNVFGNLRLTNTKITNLPDTLYVKRDLFVQNMKLSKIPSHMEIRGYFFIYNSAFADYSDYELHTMYNINGIIDRDTP